MDQSGADISRRVWKAKYRYLDEATIARTWRRLARALAVVESKNQARWVKRFCSILEDFRFLPGGPHHQYVRI